MSRQTGESRRSSRGESTVCLLETNKRVNVLSPLTYTVGPYKELSKGNELRLFNADATNVTGVHTAVSYPLTLSHNYAKIIILQPQLPSLQSEQLITPRFKND